MKIDALKAVTGLYATVIILWILGIIGWVMNIVDIISMMSGELTAMLIIRLVGVFVFPLGAILGYF